MGRFCYDRSFFEGWPMPRVFGKEPIVSEMFRSSVLSLTLACLPLVAGCGKGHTQSASKTGSAVSESTSTAADTTMTDTSLVAKGPTYKTKYDEKAVYGLNDLPGRGSYLKLDFTSLTPVQLNRVVHRLRTENCTCGCEGDLIDQCLVNDPNCSTAVTLANQIIREEKMKS
jgi:hypothetical protein